MNQIVAKPNQYDFGHDFNYDLWTSDTTITLCNVPWSNDYRDIVAFPSHVELNAYIDSMGVENSTIHKLSYVNVNAPVKINTPFNRAYQYNYIRVSNPAQPIAGDVQRDYYYFILDMKRMAGNTTVISVQLDVITSFLPGIEFGNCYIERGHIGIANERQMDVRGRSFLTIPEGLDTGADYQIVATDEIFRERQFDAIITSTTDLTVNPGDVNNPTLQSANGGSFGPIPTATETYVVSLSNLPSYFAKMSAYPWVTQGIIRVVLVPRLTNFGYSVTSVPVENNYPPNVGGVSHLKMITAHTPARPSTAFVADDIYADVVKRLPDRYKHLRKFAMSPYTVYEISPMNGGSASYKPENFGVGTALFNLYMTIAPGNERIEAVPQYYNQLNGHNELPAPGGETFDAAVGITNFPTLPVVNNMALSALASQAHGLAQARNSADWSQTRALAGNQAGYDTSTLGANNAANNARIGRNQDIASTGIGIDASIQGAVVGAAANLINNVGAGAAVGGAVGAGLGAVAGVGAAVSSGAQTAINANAANAQLAARNNANSQTAANDLSTSNAIRDTNKSYGDFAARGDYANTIAAINAKVQDTALTQPAMSGGFGGEFARIIYNGFYFEGRMRMLDRAAIRRIGEYWLRYGYAVQQFAKPPASLMVMSKFTYWKMTETYLLPSRVPETFRQTIRGVFEKGVTVWANPDDIGNIDTADNEPLAGVTLPT